MSANFLLMIHLNKDYSHFIRVLAIIYLRLSSSASDTSPIKSPLSLFSERRSVYVSSIAPTRGLLCANIPSPRDRLSRVIEPRTQGVDCHRPRLQQLPFVPGSRTCYRPSRMNAPSLSQCKRAWRDTRSPSCYTCCRNRSRNANRRPRACSPTWREFTHARNAVSFARDVSGTIRDWTRSYFDIVLGIRKGRDTTANTFGVNRVLTKTPNRWNF